MPPRIEPFFAAPAGLRRRLVDAVGQAAERQRLQPHLAGAAQRREEQPLAAEERRLHLADELDVVGRRSAAARRGSRCRRAASRRPPSSSACTVPPACTKHRPSPSSFCMMKPSPPNRPTPILRWKAMPTDTPRAAHRNESFWQIELAADGAQVHRQDLAGVGRRERHAVLAAAPWFVNTVMNRLSPVSRRLPAPSSASSTPAALRLAAVAEDRLELRCRRSCTSSTRPRRPRLARDRARPRRTASRCRGS